jgi:hypothetical protein
MNERFLLLERSIERDLEAVELDPQRLRLVLRKAMQFKAIYRPQFERFLDFLRTLRSDG